MIAAFITFTLALLATAGALASLKPTRAWLREKREKRSAKRVFRYRKFLPKERVALRRKLLNGFARGAVAWDPEIGVVLAQRPYHRQRKLLLEACQVPSLRISEWFDNPAKPVTYQREEFTYFELRYEGDAFGNGHGYRMWALLIDEADEAGLKALCREVDGIMEVLQSIRRQTFQLERLPCPTF